jgi:hypothetical protein
MIKNGHEPTDPHNRLTFVRTELHINRMSFLEILSNDKQLKIEDHYETLHYQ